MNDFILFLIIAPIIGAAPFIIYRVICLIQTKKILGAKMCISTIDEGVYCKIVSMDKNKDTVEYIYCDKDGNYFPDLGDKVYTSVLSKYFVKGWKKFN